VIAANLEEDLAAKAKQLRQLVQRQSPSSRIDEISLKTIEYPPQLITPFTSAITFTVTVGNEAPMKLMFPVTADLGGSWKLPTPDEIQKAYQAAKDQPPAPVAASEPQEAPATRSKATTSPSPASGTGSTLAGGAAPAAIGSSTTTASGARMTQRADGVFVFDWGDGSSAAGAAAPNVTRPGRPAPATGAVARPATPAPAPVPAPAAAPPAPRGATAPPPVMPIVGDRVIRFND
jgi:hypothetical protein